jgi:hypothetical protein
MNKYFNAQKLKLAAAVLVGYYVGRSDWNVNFSISRKDGK